MHIDRVDLSTRDWPSPLLLILQRESLMKRLDTIVADTSKAELVLEITGWV
jgi:hypothetical protein